MKRKGDISNEIQQEAAYGFIAGRRQKELDEAVQAIGCNVTGIHGDVAKLTDLDRLYEAVKTKGRIDVVFANAGVAEFAPFSVSSWKAASHLSHSWRCLDHTKHDLAV